MILMEEYVSLTTATMKMGKRHFYCDHSNDWLEEKMLKKLNNELIVQKLITPKLIGIDL